MTERRKFGLTDRLYTYSINVTVLITIITILVLTYVNVKSHFPTTKYIHIMGTRTNVGVTNVGWDKRRMRLT